MQNNPVTAEKIVESFNTWKFKREQPFTLEKLTEAVDKHLEEKEPVKFIMYWGIGDKNETMDPELQTFEFLKSFFQRIKDIYVPGIALSLIFTDNHGRLNGYSDERISDYFSSIKEIADKEGYHIVLLSEIVPYDRTLLEKRVINIQIDPELSTSLLNSSRKHFKASEDAEQGMKLYYVQNQIEKKALEDKFKDSIFLTFNGSEMNALFPVTLPIFYMYSLHTKTSVKPWFE